MRRCRWVSVLAVVGAATSATASIGSAGASQTTELPKAITAIMDKPRYQQAKWSLFVTDLESGETVYELNPDDVAFTGSTRKMFSVGLGLDTLGADHRFTTPVYRQGTIDPQGSLQGDLVLVGAGDLTLGGRVTRNDGIAVTDFDHNDANNLGGASLTKQDPLHGLDELAREVEAAGITSVAGDVVIDDRLFDSYRVPNQQLLITPTMINENMVDVVVKPTRPGRPAKVEYRPESAAFEVTGTVNTVRKGKKATVTIPEGDANGTDVVGVVNCVGTPDCTGEISGNIPVDYKSPITGKPEFVGTFRIENHDSYARTAFIEALQRAGVTVASAPVGPNPVDKLPAEGTYNPDEQVAAFVSPVFADYAKLIMKVSLNLGANLSLTHFGLENGDRTLPGALAVERQALIDEVGIDGGAFDFPTNGSGSPDSRATPRAEVEMLAWMSTTPVAEEYKKAFPILGVDGAFSEIGTDDPARGHVFLKPGTTLENGELVAQNVAGYIDTKSGKRLAFVLFMNDYGPIGDVTDVLKVFADEGAITNAIYENA
jgi:D-alanyl-D-alanine carboxypeptidase/D-alanyl-D-alanine-endopeptidase (penicillin-binding protein 4)